MYNANFLAHREARKARHGFDTLMHPVIYNADGSAVVTITRNPDPSFISTIANNLLKHAGCAFNMTIKDMLEIKQHPSCYLPFEILVTRASSKYITFTFKSSTAPAWKHDAGYNPEFLGAKPATAGEDY